MNHFLSAAKNTLGLFLLLPSLAWSQYSVEQCVGGFRTLQFSTLNFDAYPTYFDEDSTFTLAQTGTYKGPDAIEEYVRFVEVATIYWDEKGEGLESVTNFSPTRWDPVGGSCVFTMYSTQYLKVNATLTNGEYAYYGAITNIKYSIPDNKIRAVTLYYVPDFLETFFGLLNTPGIHNFVCETLYSDTCTAELAGPKETKKKGKKKKEKYTKKLEKKRRRDVRKCARTIGRLPVAEGDLKYADGNTQACRAVHAIFAEKNPFHCAHIALEPTEDPAGQIKCAVSEGVSPDQFFNDDEVTGFLDFCKASAVVDDNCYRITTAEQIV